MPTDDNLTRPKRKDAALNNERLVQAAREVFARQGLSATLEDIAKHAGVGVGTVYRNFASKREIVETLYNESLDAVVADVRAAISIEDPWLAVQTMFETAAARQAQDRALCELMLGEGEFAPADEVIAGFVALLTPLFDRAHAAGVLRADVSVTDVAPIFVMLNGVYGLDADNPEAWRRYLAVILDGLRAPR
jgi:AcrR family transcriptional regulator